MAAYGILAADDMLGDLREQILKAGLYVARIHDQVFELDVPVGFRPKAYWRAWMKPLRRGE